MNTAHRYLHSPGAALDYGLQWSGWLAAGETITASGWAVTSPLALTGPMIAGSTTSTFVSGSSVVGSEYILTNTITTSSGRTDSRSLRLLCAVR